MANFILFLSSLTIIGIPLIGLNKFDTFVSFVIFNGVLSSVLNHGLTSKFLQIYDRLSMGISAFYCSFEEKSMIHLSMISIIFFLLAKKYNIVWFHLLSHIFCSYYLSQLL
jgi:hypothetical protein